MGGLRDWIVRAGDASFLSPRVIEWWWCNVTGEVDLDLFATGLILPIDWFWILMIR